MKEDKTRVAARGMTAMVWVSILGLVLVQTVHSGVGLGHFTVLVSSTPTITSNESSSLSLLFSTEEDDRPAPDHGGRIKNTTTTKTATTTLDALESFQDSTRATASKAREPSQKTKTSKKRFHLTSDEAALVELLNSKERLQAQMDMDEDIIPILRNQRALTVNQTAADDTGKDSRSATPQNIQNLHIAFIGDSVVRYFYNSFALFLHTGYWPDPNTRNATVAYMGGHRGWNNLFRFVNQQLAPYEQCDCIRKSERAVETYENRYYFDPSRNVSLTFIVR
jgi:hypothetical protein